MKEESYEYGKNLYYFKGQVCVWRGCHPYIFRIKENSNRWNINIDSTLCYKSTSRHSHNDLHYTNIRPATKDEVKLLGKNQIIIL